MRTPKAPRTIRPSYSAMSHQRLFHGACEDPSVNFTWLCSGVGGGKTAAGAIEALRHLLHVRPGLPGLIVVPDFSTWTQVILPEIQKLWPSEVYSSGKDTDGSLILRCITPQGTTPVWIRSAHNRQHVDKILGRTVGWAWLEEACRMTVGELAFLFTLQRCRAGGLPPRVWITGSPRPGWLPRVFGVEDGIPPEARGSVYRPKPGYAIVQASTSDNTFLSPEYYSVLSATFKGEFREQELEGKVLKPSGLVYPTFNRAVHVVPDDLAQSMRIKRRIGGIDFGWTAPCALVWGGWTDDDEYVVQGEYYRRECPLEEQGAFAAKLGPLLWYADSAEPRSIETFRRGFSWHDEQYSLDILPAKKEIVAQEGAVRELMELRQGRTHPVLGVDLGAPRIYISDRCSNLIREMGERRHRDDMIETPEKPPREEDRIGDDHALNALEYAVFNSTSGLATRTYGHPAYDHTQAVLRSELAKLGPRGARIE